MQHIHSPTRKDDEICCRSCGIVLGSATISIEMPNSFVGEELIYPGLDRLMVGIALEKSIDWKFQDNRQIKDYQNVLARFVDLCNKEGLPKRIAYETMTRLLKKRRGMYSYRLQIRELIDVLKQDYRFLYKVKSIQQKYEMVSGI